MNLNFEKLLLEEKREFIEWLKNKEKLVLELTKKELEEIEKTLTSEELEFWIDFFYLDKDYLK